MSDILTRLLLDTKDYDSKLKRAKGSTQDFASSIGSKAAMAVGKFATGIGLAMGGMEAFNKVMQSSQTLGDSWNNTINACKGSVDMFFQSLATGNWDAFNGGLLQTISNMRTVSAMKDMLDDAKLTMGFDTRKFEREYVRLEGIIDNETKSKSEREAAFADMEALIGRFKDRVQKTAEGAANTLVAEMNAKFGQNFIIADLEKYIEEVNNEFLNTETLQRLNEYKAKLATFNDGRSQAINGYVLTKEQFVAQNAELEKMRILQDDNDESRKNMLAQMEYATELYRRADEYLKRSLEKQNKIASLNKVSGGGKASVAVVAPKMVSEMGAGQQILNAMNGKKIEPIEVPIAIKAATDDYARDLILSTKRIEDMNAALSSTGEIFGSLGGIMSSFGNDMGAWMLGTVGQIAQMIVQLQSLATANGVASASKLPFPANIAAIATVVATIASVFSSLPKFAEGGIVGGSSYFGDKLLARVNSGEMILNQGQQARLLSLTEGGNVRVTGDVRLNGKDIYISLRNYMASSGNRL
jgi:hypothetical protein